MFRDRAGGSHGGVQTRCCAIDAAGRAEVGECIDKECNVEIVCHCRSSAREAVPMFLLPAGAAISAGSSTYSP